MKKKNQRKNQNFVYKLYQTIDFKLKPQFFSEEKCTKKQKQNKIKDDWQNE